MTDTPEVHNTTTGPAVGGVVVQAGHIVGNVTIVSGDRVPRSAYREQVRRIAPESLRDRERELARLSEFCTAPDGRAYLWWRARAWAGKSALLAWFVLHPPAGVRVVSFFVTARYAGQSDRVAFTDVLLEQLAELLHEPVPAYLTEATRDAHLLSMLADAARRCADRGERLVLVVDGLDEDRGVTTAPDAHSIAALLPAHPAAGLRVVVAGRPEPPLPADVPGDHPLRDPGVVEVLSPSPHAATVRAEAERELKRLLRGTSTEQDLLGLVATAGGGLGSGDLAELTGSARWEVDDELRAVSGRTFRRRAGRPGDRPEVYLLAHEELQNAAVAFLGPSRLDGYRQRLHAWAARYRDEGWPAGTPDYLLRGYFPVLHATGDLTRMIACALDPARHDRMLDVIGGDTTALAEITTAQDALLDHDPADLRNMTLLAARRDSLVERNRHVPVALPAVWARLGRPIRAHALARSIADPLTRVEAMAKLCEALAEHPAGEEVRADEVLGEAEEIVHGIGYPQERDKALALVAGAAARSGNLDHGVALAHEVAGEHRRAEALSGVAAAGARAGDVRGATAVARTIPERFPRFQALREVAKAAARAGDLDQAVAVAGEATDPGEQAEVLRWVAEAGARTGDFRGAAAVARAIADPVQRAWALAGMAEAATRAGDFDRAARFASDAVAVARDRAGQHGRTTTLVAAARAVCWAGDHHRAANLARAVPDPGDRARALVAVAEAVARSGELDRAATIAREAEAAARAVDPTDQQAWVLAAVVKAAALARDTEYATHLADHAWSSARTVVDNAAWRGTILAEVLAGRARGSRSVPTPPQTFADPYEQDQVLARAAETLIRDGDLDAAEALARALADPARQARTITLVALAADHDRAAQLAHHAEMLVRTPTSAPQRALALAEAASAVARTGDLDRAAELARHAETFARTTADPRWRAQAMAAAARALARSGRADRATALITEAEALADVLTDERDREWVRMIVAEAAAQAGDTAHGLDVAHTITNRLNRAPVLAEVIAAVARAGDIDHARHLVQGITDDSYGRLRAAAAAARAAAEAGHHAHVLVRDVEALARDCGVDSWRAEFLAAAATAAGRAGEADHARRLIRDAATIARTAPGQEDRIRELALVAKAAARAGDRDHATTLAREAEAGLRTATVSSPLAWALGEVIRALALTGHPHQAVTLARDLAPRFRASALGYVARHVDPADARPLIARALRLADWRDTVDALAAVEPAALTDVAEAFLAETATETG